jgi:universal stress protein A
MKTKRHAPPPVRRVALPKAIPANRTVDLVADEGSLLKLKRIFVPIDFSPQSIKALRYAVPLAQKFGGAICLVNVVESGSFLDDFKSVPIVFSKETRAQDAKARLVILAQKEIGKLIPVFLHVRTGKAHEEIVAAARKLEADLIIIATHGYTGLRHTLLGSTAEMVVRLAPCPVLVVRERQRDFL